jgi:hypothetical protein
MVNSAISHHVHHCKHHLLRIKHCGKIAVLSISHLKMRIFGQNKGEAEDQPAGILKYVEDLRRGLNVDIGRKDLFEMAYSLS